MRVSFQGWGEDGQARSYFTQAIALGRPQSLEIGNQHGSYCNRFAAVDDLRRADRVFS